MAEDGGRIDRANGNDFHIEWTGHTRTIKVNRFQVMWAKQPDGQS